MGSSTFLSGGNHADISANDMHWEVDSKTKFILLCPDACVYPHKSTCIARKLSAMIENTPQIAELDFNPVKVMPRGEGYWVVDARIMVK